jgi:hypothetical protein
VAGFRFTEDHMNWKDVISDFVVLFLQAALPLLASMLVAWALPKVAGAWAEFKRVNAPAAFLLEEYARMAVKAAEQSHVAGLIDDKRKYAFDLIERQLALQGYRVDLSLIYAAIEAAVLDEFNRGEPQLITIGPGDPDGEG